MEFEDSKDIRRSTFDTTLKIIIKDFPTAIEYVFQSGPIYFAGGDKIFLVASVCTNRVQLRNCYRYDASKDDEITKSWLEFRASVTCGNYKLRPRNGGISSCIVSVIDIEGSSRCPKTFSIPSEGYMDEAKYLETSYILENSDEFLPKGVLTLRCDFSLDFNTCFRKDVENYMKGFLFSIPHSAALNRRAEIEHPCIMFTLFDFTFRILNLPLFHESRKRFGVHGIVPVPWPCSEAKEDSSDILAHVWVFDTPSNRFLLSLDEREDSVGVRLLKASPVIERMVSTDMKEGREKHITFRNIETGTFELVLYFLEKGMFPPNLSHDFFKVYEFCRMYQMEELQRKIAEELTKRLKCSDDFITLEEFVVFREDEYLSTLFEEFENLEQPRYYI